MCFIRGLSNYKPISKYIEFWQRIINSGVHLFWAFFFITKEGIQVGQENKETELKKTKTQHTQPNSCIFSILLNANLTLMNLNMNQTKLQVLYEYHRHQNQIYNRIKGVGPAIHLSFDIIFKYSPLFHQS